MIYKAYIDDSADRNRERVIISGAIIGQEEKWKALNRAWKARLDVDGLEYFKSSHCQSLNGQFHKWRSLPNGEGKIKADSVRDDLDSIIRDSGLVTLGVVLPVPFYKTMYADQGKFGNIPRIPYQLAFQQTLAECAKSMLLMRQRNSIVTFGHDGGDDFPVLYELYREFKRLNPHYARVMANFSPLDDKLNRPVQAADVAAFVTYKYAEEWASAPSSDNLKRLNNSMYKIIVWGDKMNEPSILDKMKPAKCGYAIPANESA